MGLYTIRYRMVPGLVAAYGAGYCEMTHHISWETDGEALASLEALEDRITDSDISRNWVCVRGDLVHEVAVYRRDIGDASVWVPIGSRIFKLTELLSLNDIPGVSVPLGLDPRERHTLPHIRGAVLVTETTGNPICRRRIYVGPLSATAVMWETPSPVGWVPQVRTWAPHPIILDEPFDPDTDAVDLHPLSLVLRARDHCANLEDACGDGFSVVASFRHGLVLPVLQTRANHLRAELRSRGARTFMSEPTGG